jgi:hypothetical protein
VALCLGQRQTPWGQAKKPHLNYMKLKLSFDNLVAIKAALQMRLEFLEEEIKKAERAKNQNNLDFWSERHQALVLAIQNLQEVI